MKKALSVLNRLVNEKIINDYAIGGAMGAMFYTEEFNLKGEFDQWKLQ